MLPVGRKKSRDFSRNCNSNLAEGWYRRANAQQPPHYRGGGALGQVLGDPAHVPWGDRDHGGPREVSSQAPHRPPDDWVLHHVGLPQSSFQPEVVGEGVSVQLGAGEDPGNMSKFSEESRDNFCRILVRRLSLTGNKRSESCPLLSAHSRLISCKGSHEQKPPPVMGQCQLFVCFTPV